MEEPRRLGAAAVIDVVKESCSEPRNLSTFVGCSEMAQLQIRDVPSDLHRKLRARAANMGQSLSEYALDELAKSVERSELAELASGELAGEPVVTDPSTN